LKSKPHLQILLPSLTPPPLFHIRYEYLSESYPRFRVYKIRDQHQIMQYTLHESFSDIIKQSLEYPAYDHYFMLDESRFSFFRFDIFKTYGETFSLKNLDDIIAEKLESIQSIGGEKIMTYIDTIFVDGEEKRFVIGEKWEIFFRLYIIFVDKTTINQFNSSYGNVLLEKNITIIPESFYTLMFLRNNLKKENFVLLYITENYCKAIVIKNGFYHNIEVLNLWISALKQMYKDNSIVQYRYKDYAFIESNQLAKWLIMETLNFYSTLFCKRFFEKNLIWNDVVVVSPITRNVHFIEAFDKEYKKISNNYIVPFHYSDYLSYFDTTWEPEDMDGLILINKEAKIKRLLTAAEG